MSGRPDWLTELHDLLDRLQDGGFTESDRLRLNELLRAGAPQRECFITYMDVHSLLAWEGGQWAAGEGRGMAGLPAIMAGSEEEGSGFSVGAAVNPPHQPVEPPRQPGTEIPGPEPLVPPAIILSPPPFPPLSTIHHPLSTNFVGGPVFSYMVATVILGMMLLGAWAYKITHFQQIAEKRSRETLATDRPELVFVGRITGMVDCRWADPSTEAFAGASVPLDRKYALASGLMEITYHSGAKVILQGPCTYEVESRRGGYLSLGKLTAKVQKGLGVRDQGSEEVNPTSPGPWPLTLDPFCVRTPTAIVTDLGTEFGVDVSEEGNTTSHVFRGSVRVQVVASERGTGPIGAKHPSGRSDQLDLSPLPKQGLVLRENESARVEMGDGKPSITRRVPGKDSGFVLEMPPPKSVRDSEAYAELVLSFNPVVYYRMERPEKGTGPIGAKPGTDRRLVAGRSGQLDLSPFSPVFDSAPGGRHGELRLGNEFGSPYVPGRFGSALWLRGPVVCDRVVVPDYPKATDDRLTVSAWVLATGRPGWAAIVSNWRGISWKESRDQGQFYIGLYQFDGDLCVYAMQRDGQIVRIREGASQQCPLFVWQHVALVADGTSLHLYRNGKEVASDPCAGILPHPTLVGLGVGCKLNNETGTDAKLDIPGYNFWQGRIDEAAVFNQALSAETIQALYLGKPLPNQNKTTTNSTKGGHQMNGP